METKECSRCDRTKQESEFSKRKLSSDGQQACPQRLFKDMLLSVAAKQP